MISVIIPSYNRSKLLKRAIESVLAQGPLVSEIIVVDDGSIDDTRKVCSSYDEKVVYIYQSNAGASAARNNGAKQASCHWIAFLDSDDFWAPLHITRLVDAISATDGSAVFYFSDMQMEEGTRNTTLWECVGFSPPGPHCLVADGASWAFMERQPTMLQSSVFRKADWIKAGGLDPRFRLMHDTELFFRLSVGLPICAVNGVGCIQTSDDTSQVRLTTALNSNKTEYWNEWILIWRELLSRRSHITEGYIQAIRYHMAAAHWRIARIFLRQSSLRSIRHLVLMARAEPRFLSSLIRYRGTDFKRPQVLPRYH